MSPEIPDELWMLWVDGDGEATGEPTGFWCRAVDGGPKDLFLVCRNEADAREAAEHQALIYFLDCHPVRVK